MAAVQRFLEKDIDKRTDKDLEGLYKDYLGNYTFLRNCTMDEAMEYAHDQWSDDQRMARLEMLAELWYVEGSYKLKPLRDMLLQKAYDMYDYLDANSNSFSISRREKMQQIRTMLQPRS